MSFLHYVVTFCHLKLQDYVIYLETTTENGCLTKTSFFNGCLWRRGVGKTKFTKKLLKSRLIAPPPERIV